MKMTKKKLTEMTTEDKASDRGEQRAPAYFLWAAKPSPKPYLLDVLGLDEEACNLGYILPTEGKFKLDVCDPARVTQDYKWPPHFQGWIEAHETMQVELVAVAENARSNTLRLKITWHGQWDDDPEKMKDQLMIETLPPSMPTNLLSRFGLRIWGALKMNHPP